MLCIPASKIAYIKDNAFANHIKDNANGPGEKAWYRSVMSHIRQQDKSADITW